MAKNRFAQPLYGKIIYIFETDLKMEELSTIFSPKTYWIDVTGIDCEVGYIQEFREGEGVVWVAPPNEERTFEQEKSAMLEKVDAWTSNKITGGFISNGVRYDSDMETQTTMQGIALNVNTERFTTDYPNGIPVRGYDEGATEKTIHYLTAEEVLMFCVDLSEHIGRCKLDGWTMQQAVHQATTKEELDSIILD